MSISGLGQSYLSFLNGARAQQKTAASLAVMDIPQPVDPTQVTISAEARAAAAAAAAASGSFPSIEAPVGNGTPNVDRFLSMDTDQGQKDINVDSYFSPSSVSSGIGDLKSLPPLLFPSPRNIDALAKDASGRLKAMIADQHIPFGPSSISYDSSGQIQLPSDYPYSDEFKQALKGNPVLERELSTANALTSQLVGMRSSAEFSEEYSKATTKAQVDAVLAKYHSLFDGTQHQYKITLGFDQSGNITPLADGQPYSDILTSPKNANANNWTTDTTITTPDGKVIKTQWVEVNKMLDATLSSEDKKALGFPFSSNDPNVSSSLTMLALTIKQQRELGYLKGPLTTDYLFGSGENQLDLKNSPNFNTAPAKAALAAIASRIDNAATSQQAETISPSVQAHLDEIKSKPAMMRTREDFEYQIAHDKKLAQIKAKDVNDRTAEEVDYEQKALGFVNTMAGLSSSEKALYDEAVASGNRQAAEALSKIGFLRVTSNQAGGLDGSTYDPNKIGITPETIAAYFSQSFVDPEHQSDQQFRALSDFLKLRSHT